MRLASPRPSLLRKKFNSASVHHPHLVFAEVGRGGSQFFSIQRHMNAVTWLGLCYTCGHKEDVIRLYMASCVSVSMSNRTFCFRYGDRLLCDAIVVYSTEVSDSIENRDFANIARQPLHFEMGVNWR